MVLGMKTVKLLSLSFSLVGSLPSGGVKNGFDFGQYWKRSLTSAVAGRSLAKLAERREADEIFLVGLLGHIGRLAITTCLGELYQSAAQEGGSWLSTEQERQSFGFTSWDVGATLLQEWELPASICVPVGYCSTPDELPEDATEDLSSLTRIAHCAHTSR